MSIDGYGFFAVCRKIACLAILLAFSSSAQAIFKESPIGITFESTDKLRTKKTAQEYSFVVGEITITDGSTQTQWSIGKGEGELEYGVADFILSLDRPDVTVLTRTPTTMGQTVFYRYSLLEDPSVSVDEFDVIAQDGTRKTTLTVLVGVFNDPPRVYDSEGEMITSETAPKSVGTYTATFAVGEVSTIVFSADEAKTLDPVATAQYFTWSIIPNVDSLATVFFANTDESQFIASPQIGVAGSDVGVVYKSSPGENIADAGYTLVVRDTLGGAATVTVLLTPEFPMVNYKGSPVEGGELAVSIEELGNGHSFELSADTPACLEVPECLSWSSDDVDITPTPTAGGDTVRVTVPEGTDVGSSFTVTVLVSGSTPVSVATVNVTIVANMAPRIVSIDGFTGRTFNVSPNLGTVRFPVVATDDFDPESMTWTISSAAGSGKGTASFFVNGDLQDTAMGSIVMVDFKKGSAGSTFTLTVTDRAGLFYTTTVTINPSGLPLDAAPPRLEGGSQNIYVDEAPSSLVLTFRASDGHFGEQEALRWSVYDLVGLVIEDASSVTTGLERKLVLSFTGSSTQVFGTFTVQIENSYQQKFRRIVTVEVRDMPPIMPPIMPPNLPPIVTARVDDVSFSSSGEAGTIGLPEAVVTTAISFSVYDPGGQPPEGNTFKWALGEQSGVRVFFVGTDRGENVVVRFEEPPVEGNYFVIRVTDNRFQLPRGIIFNTIRMDTLPKEVEQFRIRTFLGGAVR